MMTCRWRRALRGTLVALPLLALPALAQNPPPGMVWSTYLGGSQEDQFPAWVLRVAGNGDVIVAGAAASANFPIAPGAYQSTYGGHRSSWLGDGVFARIRTEATASRRWSGRRSWVAPGTIW